jgi:hypothetical protein
MPAKHFVLLAGIIIFFVSSVLFSYTYGPRQRSFASPAKVLSLESTAQINTAWESSGVKGRIAICFTRYLNALESKESRDVKATEISMNHGIVRKVFHVPPDSAWPEIKGALSKRSDMRTTSAGFIGVFQDGRIYIQPLSHFSPVTEQALVIVEPRVWTSDELERIAGLLASGGISSDILVVIRGSQHDAELFRNAMKREAR